MMGFTIRYKTATGCPAHASGEALMRLQCRRAKGLWKRSITESQQQVRDRGRKKLNQDQKH